MRDKFTLTWNHIVAIVVVGLLFVAASWYGVEAYTSTSAFCGGTCHTMTEQYTAWKKEKHHAANSKDGAQAECIECHFLPGDKYSLKAKYEGLRHLFAYLYDAKAPLPIRPKIPDGACLQSGCHDKAEFEEKELKFAEKGVNFKHKVHFSEKALEGQPIFCDTCHFKVTAGKHFEVPKDICFLCHLKLEAPTLKMAEIEKGKIERISFSKRPAVDFNQGASKCSICHTIPTKSLQAQLKAGEERTDGKKPITHQTLQDAGVPCESCHFELVKGHGEINTGNVVSNGCLTCHNRSEELLTKSTDKKLMHDKHVATRTADCFDCHSVVEHKKQANHYDFVRRDCTLCHEEPHMFQQALLTGNAGVEGVTPTPQLMDAVNTNCLACHVKKRTSRGHAVRTGSGEACSGCHTEEHKQMLVNWRNQINKELRSAREVEGEALMAMSKAKAEGVAEDKVKEAQQMVLKGQQILTIVEFGKGVHNKKFSIMLLDEVYGNFEDAIDLLQSGG